MLGLCVGAKPAYAQFDDEPKANPNGAQPDKAETLKLKIGVKITADGGPCAGLRITAPVPIDWPEQKVKIIEEKSTPNVRNVTYVNHIAGGVRQMIVQIPNLQRGETAESYVIYEIKRSSLIPPEDTSKLKVPEKPGNDVKKYLTESPYIEVNNSKISALAKELPTDKKNWERVEAIYDLIRSKVKYEEGPLKGAVKALQDGTGDCEELTSLFIALCRQQRIPARTVWVSGHCYPEFYLVDEDGKGHWFPCQAAGTRAFGGIPEHRAILQKGDNFTDPDRPRERLRYVSEFMKGSAIKGSKQPSVDFIRKVVE